MLSNATTPAEAQAALTAPSTAKPQPKTFHHAMARAALSSSQTLHQQHTGAGEDPLATALEKYALAMERVGEARLAQDAQVQSRFLAGWTTTLNTNILFATRARKAVEKARLTLDAVKARVKGTTWKLPGVGGGPARDQHHDDHELSPEAQEEIEKAEDEFVTQTEEAVGVMKNVSWPRAFLSWTKYPFRPSFCCCAKISNPFLFSTGPRVPRASAQSGRTGGCPDGVPQEGARDSERAGAYH
jgi:hypothetical protein